MRFAWIRQTALYVHRYGGLAAAVVLLAVSLTGTALVVLTELEAWSRAGGDRLVVEGEITRDSASGNGVAPAAEPLELEAVRAAVADWIEEEKVACIERPAREDRRVTVWTTGPRKVYVHPYSGAILGAVDPEETWTGWIAEGHAELLAGRAGRWIVGGAGLLLALLSVTGLCLGEWRSWRWAPSRSDPKRGSAFGRDGSGISADLHRTGGLWTSLICLLIGLTGAGLVVYPSYPGDRSGSAAGERGETRSELSRIRGGELAGQSVPRVEPAAHGERIVTLDAALETARRMWPSGQVSVLCLPDEPTDPLIVRIRAAGELAPRGQSVLHLDPYRGNVVGVSDVRAQPFSRRIRYALRPLHTGSFAGGGWPAGWIVRTLYVLGGCVPVMLSLTGTIMWFRRFVDER